MHKIRPIIRLLLIIAISALGGAFVAALLLRPAPPPQTPATAPTIAGRATAAPGPAATAPASTEPEATSAPATAAPAGAAASAPIPPLPAGAFLEPFDGQPASPQPWNPPGWDVTVHSRDVDTWDQLEGMSAMHGPDCGAPPATHQTSSYEGAVFLCRDHMMTAINASGYGAIYLTPNQQADFSQGEATIRWDMSTLRTSQRDWVDLWISPFDEQLQLPLDMQVDLSGPPRDAVQIRLDQNRNLFIATVYRDFKESLVLGELGSEGYESFLTPDAKRRDTFEVRISRTHLSVGMPGYGFKWIDSEIPDLGWDRGVVQLGHHSYNPMKDCEGPCSPNTWHWDNVAIAPARPFTMLKADRRFADASAPGALGLAAPAPARAHLRFAGIGAAIELSFDGGASWQPAQLQAQNPEAIKDEHFRSYWTPIPAGTARVLFRGQDWYGGRWYVRDIAVWAE